MKIVETIDNKPEPQTLTIEQAQAFGLATLTLSNNYKDEMLMVGFTCQICEGSQSVPSIEHIGRNHFPVCDQCKRDLKDYVMSVRKK